MNQAMPAATTGCTASGKARAPAATPRSRRTGTGCAPCIIAGATCARIRLRSWFPTLTASCQDGGRDDSGERWRAARGVGATVDDADLDAAGTYLLGRWSEPQRQYHDVTHLTAVLDVIDRFVDLAPHPDRVRVAAWLHDAVYDPRALGDANERDSAEFAEELLTTLGAPAGTAAEVARLVALTPGTHRGTIRTASCCASGPAILAADGQRYAEYTAAIRREYAHVAAGLPAGRAQVLRRCWSCRRSTAWRRCGSLEAAPGRTCGASQRGRCLGRRSRWPARAASSRGGSRVAPSHSAARTGTPGCRMVAVEGPPGRAQHLGETCSSSYETSLTRWDQRRPGPASAARRRGSKIDFQEPQTPVGGEPADVGHAEPAASAVRSSGIFCDWRAPRPGQKCRPRGCGRPRPSERLTHHVGGVPGRLDTPVGGLDRIGSAGEHVVRCSAPSASAAYATSAGQSGARPAGWPAPDPPRSSQQVERSACRTAQKVLHHAAVTPCRGGVQRRARPRRSRPPRAAANGGTGGPRGHREPAAPPGRSRPPPSPVSVYLPPATSSRPSIGSTTACRGTAWRWSRPRGQQRA